MAIQTFRVTIETSRRIKPSVIVAVLAQDLNYVARDGSGIKVKELKRGAKKKRAK